MPLQPMLQFRHYVFALSIAAYVHPVFSPVPNIFLSLCKNTKRILMKFVGDNYHYHEQIKSVHFGRNWNNNKGAEYERKFESPSVGFAAMSNRCWCLMLMSVDSLTQSN